MPRTVSPVTRRSVLTVTAALGAFVLTALPAAATSTPEQVATSTANGVTYLRTLQADDGSFAGSGLSNEWAFSALAAAGTAAVDVTPDGDPARNARGVYRTLLSSSGWPSAVPVVTDYERATLNAYAAGVDPARVSPSRNLIADIYGYWQTAEPGYFGPPSTFNGTVFAALALNGAKTTSGQVRVPQALRDAVVTRIRANQHDDGGWNFGRAEGNPTELGRTSDIDMTGAAMAALCESGVPNTDPDVARAKAFLKGKLVASSGAFNAMFGVNTNSNGWAVSGLNACGIDPQTGDFRTSMGRTPIDFLIAQQINPGGGFRYQPGNTTPSAYASIDAVRALADGSFTTAPPTPTTPGAPRWVGEETFTPGTPTTLALTVDDGAGDLRVCSVTLTPTGGTTTLGALLDAATTGASPAGCVVSVTPDSGDGTVTAVNGRANTGTATWKVSLDGGTFAPATRGTAVGVGDTVALRLGV